MSTAEIVTIVLLGVLLVLLLVLLLAVFSRTGDRRDEHLLGDMENLLDDTEDHVTERVTARVSEIKADITRRLYQDAEENRKNRVEVSDMIRKGSDSQNAAITALQRQQDETLTRMNDRIEQKLSAMQADQFTRLSEYSEKTQTVLTESVRELQNTNREKLSEMQAGINEKLDKELNERLDESLKNVGEQLNRLYVSLGELTKLETDVTSLNRTLSNVKTRGVFGEAQLENILANVLSPGLYERNVVTKKSEGQNRDMVEFAVKIPDKDTQGQFMYLPVDSKYPGDIYEHILKASQDADAELLRKSVKELETRIRQEAKDIRTKYLDPPATTDFAIMFLPTESLYAEVLRIPGLCEDLQKKEHVVITGPTTLAALLNSLSIGFRYMAVNKDSQNILRLLSAIKAQYGKLSELIDTADSRIELARKATTELQHRTEIINKKLSAVEELDPLEAQSLLGSE